MAAGAVEHWTGQEGVLEAGEEGRENEEGKAEEGEKGRQGHGSFDLSGGRGEPGRDVEVEATARVV